MAGSPSTVANLNIETGDSKQNLEELQSALVASGDAGIKSADKITNGFKSIEDQSNRLTKTIENGGTVSDSSLTSMAAKYVALQDVVTQAFGSIEKAPKEYQAALQIAENQIVSVNTRQQEMGDRAAEVAQHFKTLGAAGRETAEEYAAGVAAGSAALKKLGDTATASGSTLTRVFANAKNAETELQDAIETGSPRMATAVTKLVNVHNVLSQEIAKQRALGQQIAPEMIAEYERIGKTIDTQRVRVRQLTDEMSEQKTELKEGGEQWLGLGAAINKALGPAGAAQAQAGLIIAAFREGWQIGQQLATAIGTDQTAFAAFAADVKEKGADVQNALDNVVASAANVAESLGSGNIERAKTDLDGLIHSAERAAAAYSASGDALTGLNTIIDTNVLASTKLAASDEKLIEIGKLKKEIDAGGIESQQLWNVAAKQGFLTIDELVASLRRHAAISKELSETKAYGSIQLFADLLKAASDEKEALRLLNPEYAAERDRLKEIADNADKAKTAKLGLNDAQRQTLELLTTESGSSNALSNSTTQLLDRMRDLLGARDLDLDRLKRYGGAIEDNLGRNQNYSQSLRDQLRALADQLTQSKDLTAEQKDAMVAKIAEIEASHQQVDASEKIIAVSTEHGTALSNVTESTIKLTRANGDVVDSAHKLGTGLESAGTAATNSMEHVVGLANKYMSLADQMARANGESRAFVDLMPSVIDSMQKLDAATKKAGGDTYGPSNVSSQYSSPAGPSNVSNMYSSPAGPPKP